MKSLFKTVGIILFFSIITRAVGFVFRIYLSRKLGAEMLGVYQVAFSVFIVLLTVVSSGIPLVISKLTAKYSTEKNIISERKMLSCALVISIISSILLCVFVLLANKIFGLAFADQTSVSVLLVLLPAIIFNAVYSTFRGNLWGHNKFFGVCITELFEQIARVIIAVLILEILLTNLSGAVGTALSLTIASFLSASLVVIIYFAQKRKLAKPTAHYKEILKSAMPITSVRLATSLVQPLIAIIIPLRLISAGYTSSQAMGQYGIAMGMTLPLIFIPSTIIGALCMALIPDLSSATTQNDENHISNRIFSSLIFTIFISCFFIPLYIGAGEYIGLFFYNNIMSGTLLASSAWIMLPMGLVNITSSILNALGLESKSIKNYIIGAILMIASLWFLPKFVGVKALIWAMGLCTSSAAILNIIMLRKFFKAKSSLVKPLVFMIAFIIPTAAITSFLANILTNFIPLFFVLAISCTIGALFFALLCVIFNIINFQVLIVSFKEKFKAKISKKSTIKA